ncbi:YiiX/YebB-like N1pC/P60 family cysteine hydrolase [Parendozoicomonas sp. Alg238-R29]|uniref:YiiX/YebB-like N1pC/P60 family cysteine hydrolase n=1 Tax=Parendozoicomonas sp. Alg238-R29 TaxID=2993446 RepID=UPI00248EA6AB|nr:YiiX/YebB-like N1pC/P60 family cysteine hydrolase [Parendozoicomonas sp. Alg238-R29]
MPYPKLPGPCPPIPGDLLFLHTRDEPRMAAVSRIFSGVHNFIINHVALCTAESELVEAVPPRVRHTSLDDFLEKAHPDEEGAPRVLVCRVRNMGTEQVRTVLSRVEHYIDKPYNETYMPSTEHWYCSSLVQDAWFHGNNGEHVFPETPLEFRDPVTGQIMPFWKEYYQSRGMDVPQGLPGSHPALISRSPHLAVVGCYGNFQQK